MITVSVEVIIDDVLVHSKDTTTHLKDLNSVFSRAEEKKMSFRTSKTRLGLNEIRIWSWLVSSEGIRADPKRISIIDEFQIPTTVKQVRQFIGLVNYYRRIIPNFSAVAAPLTNLMKKDGRTKIILDDLAINAFKQLKSIMTSNIIVKLPDPGRVFYVKTDAGPLAVGGVLSQFHDDIEFPVAYTSQKLNSHQKNYGQTKKELLAVVIIFRKWRQYLLDTQFPVVLITDCTAVRDLMSKKRLSGIFARWVLELQEYRFNIRYKPGNQHTDADALSRMFTSSNVWGDREKEKEIEIEIKNDIENKILNDNDNEIYFNEVFYSIADEENLNDIEIYLNENIYVDSEDIENVAKNSEKYFY